MAIIIAAATLVGGAVSVAVAIANHGVVTIVGRVATAICTAISITVTYAWCNNNSNKNITFYSFRDFYSFF